MKTKREVIATMNLEMKQTGWRQKVLLTVINRAEKHGEELNRLTIFESALTYAETLKPNESDLWWARRTLAETGAISQTWFYQDMNDTLKMMRDKGWIYMTDKGTWRIADEYKEKVNTVSDKFIQHLFKLRFGHIH